MFLRELFGEDINEEHIELINKFQCDDEDTVKEFLVNEALELHKLNLAVTKLFFNDKDKKNLIGYFTLHNDMMQIGKAKRKKHGYQLPSYKYYPSIKLHYLGVDSRFREQRYGETLLFTVLDTAINISKTTGCLFLTIESLPKAVSFYEKYEFKRLNINRPFVNMFFKLDEL
ncbi:hypothetical protein GCM10023310_72230 [Paenibacillus vulneris]|uniref:GNAT family N-acetyltransferase n=1 Tax=Paenibacillus vulneris TaxID=1133364 RepID=A0ABW3UEV6_9BACL